MLKIFLKIVKWFFIIIILPVLIYLLTAVLLSYWGTNPDELNCTEDKTVYISSNGMHIDLIFPIELLEKDFLNQLSPIATTKYYAIGWGDKGFYLDTPSWAELKPSTAMNAMLIRSPTAMHVTQYTKVKKDWIPIAVCDEQIKILHDHATSTFLLDAEGQLQEIVEAGYTPEDRFYEAHGSYTGIKTCNIWVNQGLKKAEIRTSVWSPFVFGILHHAEENAELQ